MTPVQHESAQLLLDRSFNSMFASLRQLQIKPANVIAQQHVLRRTAFPHPPVAMGYGYHMGVCSTAVANGVCAAPALP